jgi:hypothetical protein
MARWKEGEVKLIAVLFATLLLCPASFSQSDQGSICVAPISKDWPATAGTGELICSSNNFSLKLDAQKAFSWPTKESIKIEGLDIRARHRIVFYCDGKPQQSFGFRFSEFKTRELCLFLNDLYKTRSFGTRVKILPLGASASDPDLPDSR